MLPRDLQRILKIREYCSDIRDTTERFGASWEIFSADYDYQQSIAFSLLQIGELTAGLSDEFRNRTKGSVQWQLIKNLRNIIVHDYGRVIPEKIWEVIETDIPSLKAFCNEQLPTEYRQEE